MHCLAVVLSARKNSAQRNSSPYSKRFSVAKNLNYGQNIVYCAVPFLLPPPLYFCCYVHTPLTVASPPTALLLLLSPNPLHPLPTALLFSLSPRPLFPLPPTFPVSYWVLFPSLPFPPLCFCLLSPLSLSPLPTALLLSLSPLSSHSPLPPRCLFSLPRSSPTA